jgi:hypothetical protein
MNAEQAQRTGDDMAEDTPTIKAIGQQKMMCRLYGRYVMVERGAGEAKSLTFLMPDMTYGNSGFCDHAPLLTIARRFVEHKRTTLAPTFRNMTDGKPDESEDFIWDLTGWEILVSGFGGATVEVVDDKEIPDLSELEDIQGRQARLKATINPWDGGGVNTAIIVRTGVARAKTGFHTPPCEFIALNDPNPIRPVIQRPRKSQIDMIDIEIPPADEHTLTLRNRRATHTIVLRNHAELAIAFSNLCYELPHEVDVDREFAQYYHVLEEVADDRLVPKVAASGGDEDCNRPSRISVEGP